MPADPKPPEPVVHTRNKGGRPKLLHADAATLRQLRGLGQIQATVREGAAFFAVNLVTFEKFLNEPGVREAWDEGRENGRMSLRRAQINAAMKGNATMLIWTGKQYLGQKDKHDLTHTGGMTVTIQGDGGDADL